jgi:hypothetical protein
MTALLKSLYRRLRRLRLKPVEADVDHYLCHGRRPWSRGYIPYKNAFIAGRLADKAFLARVRAHQPLPPNYGANLDERVVEYPWLIAHLGERPGRLLDAGSACNHPYVIRQAPLRCRQVSIITLAPEAHCFWTQSVSYLFGDLRQLPFRSDYFDEIASISTLEHVGKDNTVAGYTRDGSFAENRSDDFLQAVRELERVCQPGGRVLVTVPFGRFMDFGWAQQFDLRLVERLIDAFAPARVESTYYRYAEGGWQISDAQACADCEGFNIHATRYMNPQSDKDYDPDMAAASRAVCALQLWKRA